MKTVTNNTKKPLFSIFDQVAGFYCPVFTAENEEHAKRMMIQSIDLSHKRDYHLWHLGYFDTDKGVIQALPEPSSVLAGKNIQSGE